MSILIRAHPVGLSGAGSWARGFTSLVAVARHGRQTDGEKLVKNKREERPGRSRIEVSEELGDGGVEEGSLQKVVAGHGCRE